jgi:hypothetical protein
MMRWSKLDREKVRNVNEVRLYAFPLSKVNELCSQAQIMATEQNLLTMNYLIPSINLRFLDEQSREVRSLMLSNNDRRHGGYGHNWQIASQDAYMPGGTQDLAFLRYFQEGSKCIYAIDTSFNFTIIVKLTEDELSRASNVEVLLER